MITRGQNFKEVPLNIVGSSVFGRYPKISIEKTFNMFESDSFMVPYAGYQIAVPSSQYKSGKVGRGLFMSTKLERLIVVIDNNVYLTDINYSQQYNKVINSQVIFIGQLQTSVGVVYITENNKPQILISDNTALYIYDPTLSPTFQVVPNLNFVPGYVTFHDTYFIAAASNDTSNGAPVSNTWRLSGQNDGLTWKDDAASVGSIQTKPDNTQAVVRFPGKGNMIFVMGSIVSESWFDVGAQLFPYQRNNQFNIDYGCLSPATVAYMDEIVVWLGINEKSGPIILYSNGGMPKHITTDGIDYLFSQLQNPQDSQGFLYRQDGHLFYHINFYSDNLSLFYDFNKDKFYHACDQNLNYFIASELAFFNNQYYFVTRNNGNLFAFDTTIYTFQDVDAANKVQIYDIPRIRICKNIRDPQQDYFIVNDVGFTIETGETDYFQQQASGVATFGLLNAANDPFLLLNGTLFDLLSADSGILYTTPAVDLSISTDGGASFGNAWRYNLFPIGYRKNRLNCWQIGLANDFVTQFRFQGMGRFVVTDGVANIRI